MELVEFLQLGEALARKGALAEPEQSMREAIEIARQQQASLVELRSVSSLARLLEAPRKQAVLRDMLEPLYRRFAEGADAADVNDARVLLAGSAGR